MLLFVFVVVVQSVGVHVSAGPLDNRASLTSLCAKFFFGDKEVVEINMSPPIIAFDRLHFTERKNLHATWILFSSSVRGLSRD